MAWKGKMLDVKYENLSVDPQDPCKTPGMARHKPVIQLGERAETIRTLWLSGQQILPKMVSSGFNEKYYLKRLM